VRRRVGLAVGGAFVLVAIAVAAVRATTYAYAGWHTSGTNPYYSGVRGYINQGDAGSVSSPNVVASWINQNTHGAGNDGWVQTGTFQGYWTGGSSPDVPHMFWENVDPCGTWFGTDVGAPPSPNYFYSISYDRQGARTFICFGGVQKTAYGFMIKKGSAQNSPFATGYLPTLEGQEYARTELQGVGTPLGTTLFGCSATQTCTDTVYAMRVFSTQWTIWTVGSTYLHDDPPWIHTYQNYWAFKTCPTAC